MTMKDLLAYSAQQKKLRAKIWNSQKDQDCRGLTEKEYKQIDTQVKKARGYRHTHRGLWAYPRSERGYAFPKYYN